MGVDTYTGNLRNPIDMCMGMSGMFDKQRSEPTERDPTTGEAGEIVGDDRTEGERMREFVA